MSRLKLPMLAMGAMLAMAVSSAKASDTTTFPCVGPQPEARKQACFNYERQLIQEAQQALDSLTRATSRMNDTLNGMQRGVDDLNRELRKPEIPQPTRPRVQGTAA